MSNMVTVDGVTFDAGTPEAAEYIRKGFAHLEALQATNAALKARDAEQDVEIAAKRAKLAALEAEKQSILATHAAIERAVDEGRFLFNREGRVN